MMKYTFDEYVMTLEDTGRTGGFGKARVSYTFSKPDKRYKIRGIIGRSLQ